MLPPAKPAPKPLHEVLFNEKLSKEFQQQYQYRFGQTQAEQVINSPGQLSDGVGHTYYSGKTVTVQDYRLYQRQYAEYMGRRLTEYHLDNYAKSSSNLRPVFTMKDRVSNVSVKSKSGYGVKWKYNLSGPTMDLTFDNPFEIEARVRLEMNGILSKPTEQIYTFGYQVNRRVRASALYRREDGLYQLVVSRQMTKAISTSFTGSVDTRKEGPTIQQNLFLLGLAWSD